MRNDFLVDTESPCFVADKAVVKTANPTLVHQPTSAGSGDRFAANMIEADTIAKTRKLLDKTIAYAWYTVKSDRRPPALTRTRWVWRLAGSYHLCYPTQPLMEEAQERFAAADRESLAQWAAEKAREEGGHDRLALLDIQSMGYDAEAVVKALFPPAAKTLVDYFTQSVYATDPIGCVGYSYTSERLAICRGEDYIQKVEAHLPLVTNATRCLRIHSGVGADIKHVEETIAMVAGLAPQERTRIAAACYETALLCFSPPKEDYISEEELEYVLKPLEHTKNHN